MNRHASALVALIFLAPVLRAMAHVFGSGANSFEIEFVAIGKPSNPPDTTDYCVADIVWLL